MLRTILLGKGGPLLLPQDFQVSGIRGSGLLQGRAHIGAEPIPLHISRGVPGSRASTVAEVLEHPQICMGHRQRSSTSGQSPLLNPFQRVLHLVHCEKA